MLSLPKQKGATLIGLLFAIAIIATCLAAGLALMGRAIRLSSVAKHEITASALAEEGVELTRNIRDAGDNYCLKNGLPLNGFDKLALPPTGLANNGNTAYGVDFTLSNFTSNIPAEIKIFDNTSAGLCQRKNVPKAFGLCPLSFAGDPNYTGRQFIRKIQILNSDYNNGGTISYNYCQGGGLLIVSTVYWKESWETNVWPTDSSDARLWNESSTDLHKVRVTGCLYNWRPE